MSKKRIDALELGGTLFVPASHKSLEAVLSGEKYPALRSVVIDFEDGLAGDKRSEALLRLEQTLNRLSESRLLRFIRVQNPQMLKTMLQQKDIDKLDGFILPKFGLSNAEEYLSIIQNPVLKIKNYNFMPSIEGEELFDLQKLQQLRDILLPYSEQIICVRFGAQDMLRQLGLKQNGSVYNMLLPRQIIANIIMTFRPVGFAISAPVYPDFSDLSGFEKEVAFELQNGLVSKTIIHPGQIGPMNRLYRVSRQELDEAKRMIEQEDGVLNLGGKMGETKTQNPWAEQILRRAELFNLL